MQSLAGDQVARVALSVLVFDRTGSGLWTAATYALTFLPALVGGLLLGGLADRYSRRTVLVVCDVLRAGLLALMAVPAAPLGLVAALLTVATLVGAPFKSAEPALLADIFTGELYSTAVGLRAATQQAAQLVGFGVGGVIVAGVGARGALVLDAATFAISAALLQVGLAQRPPARLNAPTGRVDGLLAGIRLVSSDRRLVLLLGFACLTGLWVIPEGLAAPYATATGGGAAAVGVLLAANPAGNVLGAAVFARWLPARQQARALGPLAVLTGVPLMACVWRPGLAVTIALWAASGVCTAYLVRVSAEYVLTVPAERRGQGVGVLTAGLLAAQGLGLLVGGLLTRVVSIYGVVALAGLAGSVLAGGLVRGRARLVPGPVDVDVATSSAAAGTAEARPDVDGAA